MRITRLFFLFLMCGLLMSPAFAQDDDAGDDTTTSTTVQSDSSFGWRGWGPRVGLTSGPDQIVGGVHFDLGEIAPHVWFQPDVVAGFGDDHLTLVASAPFWYRFKTYDKVTPYAGGALALGFFSVDKPGKDETNFELGLQIGGGAQWQLKSQKILLEGRIDLIDVWDFQVIVGWTF
jgi:opacity protein-like surface antigen